ncbi:DNA primase family protein [Ligilactobacillus acidipiscis]|uniref:DNA primase family protein n=1 Tax=Ligilactobacillus acidipiscis TaxID=89059 RepID=UPI0022E89636|nr:DNA primase family protein [Ligilactobacillus acidipiscis]
MEQLYRGYIKTKGKQPLEPFKNRTDFSSLKEVSEHDYAGVLGENTILVDVDNFEDSEKIMDIVEDLQLNCRVYETKRGKHFLFLNNDRQGKNVTKQPAAIGLNIDIKLGSRSSLEILKNQGVKRECIYDIDQDESYDTVPKWLLPVNTHIDFEEMKKGDGRNQALFNYILTLQANDFSKNEARECITLINKYVLEEPLEERELDVILRDDSFSKPIFFKKNKFLFDKFANFLKSEYHIKRINGVLHTFDNGIYVPGDRLIESKMIKHVPDLTKAKRKEVLEYLEISTMENNKSEDAAYIAFNNGLLNIYTDELIDYTADHIITNKIPWDYDPTAYCELTDQTLNKMACQDPEIRNLMEEMIGYTFYRRNELGKAFMLTGEKSNGKSTFLDMIKTMLGAQNVSSLDLGELGERFKTAELFGKLANIGDDIEDDFVKSTGVFKKLVTGDALNVERKGKDPFDFSNYSKLLFSANNIPRLGKGRGAAAITRRLIIIPFNAKFSKDDPDFRPYIKYDLRQPESIQYLIKIGINALKRILADEGFSNSKKVDAELEEYEVENNPMLMFFEDLQTNEYENQPIKQVYTTYTEYCVRNGMQPVSNIQFGKEIKKHYDLQSVTRRVNGESTRIYRRKNNNE